MESNEETPTTLPNETNSYPNSNHDSNSISISDSTEEDLPFIDYSSFERFSILSNDIGAEIFKAYWKDANIYVALKKIQFQYLEDLKPFYKLNYHQNIMSIFGYTKEQSASEFFLVTEYVNRGNLRQYLKEKHQYLSWNDKMKLAIDIASGLQCMHSHDIIHLILHPENIFVQNNKLLIGYLGLSKAITDVSIPENIDNDVLPYIEPNFISDPSYPRDKKSDIYSIGFVMYEISSGKSPFASVPRNYELGKKLLSGTRENPVAGTPIEFIDLYEQCWDNDPTLRPTASDVLSRLGRMNLFPVHEDTKITNTKKLKIDTNVHVKKEKDYGNNSEIISNGIISETSMQSHDFKIDFGTGTDSGFGTESRRSRSRKKKERKCKILPCLPKLRVSYGVFLCWICIIVVIACSMLGFFLTGFVTKKKN